MAFSILLLTVIICACMYVYTYVRRKNSFFKNLGIPHLPSESIFDNLAVFVSKGKLDTEIIKKIYNLNLDAKYVGIYDFYEPVIVLRDLDLIKNVVVKNLEYFRDHHVYSSDDGAISFHRNLYDLTDIKWQKYHNILLSSLNPTKMEAIANLVHDNSHNMIDRIYELAKDNPDNTYDLRDLFSKYNNDAIVNCFFGLTINSYKDPDNNFYLNGIKSLHSDDFKSHLHQVFPKLAKAMNSRTLPNESIRYFKDLIDNAIKNRNEEDITRLDFMQSMMDLKLDNSEITSVALEFLFNGQDPVTTQMCLLLYELALNPGAQKKLQDEVDSVMIRLDREGGELTYEILENMDHMDTSINESMRLHSTTHVDRICRKSFELPAALPGLKSFTVQPGSVICIPIIGLQYDPKMFRNPDRYEPERFLHSDARAVNNWNFGIGPGSCLARRFAVLQIKMAVFHIMARYDLKTSVKGNYSRPACGEFWLTFERRKKSYNKR